MNSSRLPFVAFAALFLTSCSMPMPMRDAGMGRFRPDGGITDKFPVLPAAKARKVAVGATFACALTTTGTVRCWGFPGKDVTRPGGLLGSDIDAPRVPMPVDVPGLSNVVDLDAALNHACVVLGDGTVQCWGFNDWSKLAVELSRDGGSRAEGDRATPGVIGGISGATKVALGEQHSCVLLQSGGVRCWGGDFLGQLQNRSTRNMRSAQPLDMPGISGATDLAAFSTQTCALVAGGVKCWGTGPVNGATEATPPYTVPLTGVTALALNETADCAVVNGGAKCWGLTDLAQLGNGSDTGELEPRLPVDVAGMASGVTAVTRQCAVQMGTVKCWGRDGRLLGTGTREPSTTPVAAIGFADAVQVSSNKEVTCAVTSGGQVWCWGDNQHGAVGNGMDVTEVGTRFYPAPQRVLSFE